MKTPLFTADYTTSEGGTGHPGFIFHKQPALERAIRDAIDMYPASELRTKSTITGVKDEGGHVEVEYKDAKGSTHTIRAKYLVGADGKTGYVRKKFLEPKGILMERSEGYVRQRTEADEDAKSLAGPITRRLGWLSTGTSTSQVQRPTRDSLCGSWATHPDKSMTSSFRTNSASSAIPHGLQFVAALVFPRTGYGGTNSWWAKTRTQTRWLRRKKLARLYIHISHIQDVATVSQGTYNFHRTVSRHYAAAHFGSQLAAATGGRITVSSWPAMQPMCFPHLEVKELFLASETV